MADAAALETEAGASLGGGRVRRTTQKFTFSEAKHEDPEEFTPPAGSGAKLRDIAFVSDNVAALNKKDGETLKALYNVMYGRRFQLRNLKIIKEQLLDFSGVVEQDEKSRATLFGKIAKWKRSFVQEIMDMLGVDRSKKSFDEQSKPFDKDSLINRLIDWLYNPQATTISEKKAAAAVKAEAKKERQKAQRAKKAAAKTKGTKRKSSPTATASKKKRKTKASAEDDEDEDEDMNEDTESEGEESGSDFEEDAKKSKKSPRASKSGARRAKRSRAVEEDEDENDENDENDANGNQSEGGEPAANDKSASKSAGPEDDSSSALSSELQEKVKDIIAHGNAEELTVKKIVRQLSADLGRDVSDQKKAIKVFITDGQAL